jgi:hypothetical protein
MIMENSQIPGRRTLQLRGGSTSPWGQTHNRVLISDAPKSLRDHGNPRVVDAAERDLTPAALDVLRALASPAPSPPGVRSESTS